MAGRKYEQDRSNVHKTIMAVAVSPAEKERIKQEADSMGMTMSCYIRYRLFITDMKSSQINKEA